MSTDNSIRQLSDEEAHTFLAKQRIGRMAVVLADEPHIAPVNYVYADPEGSDAPILYIRSAPGDKLFAAAANKKVAFEVDEIREKDATSVIVYGHARIVETAEEKEHAEQAGLQSWIASYKSELIAIDISDISGRSFIFGEEPDSTLIESSG